MEKLSRGDWEGLLEMVTFGGKEACPIVEKNIPA